MPLYTPAINTNASTMINWLFWILLNHLFGFVLSWKDACELGRHFIHRYFYQDIDVMDLMLAAYFEFCSYTDLIYLKGKPSWKVYQKCKLRKNIFRPDRIFWSGKAFIRVFFFFSFLFRFLFSFVLVLFFYLLSSFLCVKHVFD